PVAAQRTDLIQVLRVKVRLGGLGDARERFGPRVDAAVDLARHVARGDDHAPGESGGDASGRMVELKEPLHRVPGWHCWWPAVIELHADQTVGLSEVTLVAREHVSAGDARQTLRGAEGALGGIDDL